MHLAMDILEVPLFLAPRGLLGSPMLASIGEHAACAQTREPIAILELSYLIRCGVAGLPIFVGL